MAKLYNKTSMNNLPIGVIDSGVGGLTILKPLIEAFPTEDFIYFGDTDNAPYGEKSIEEITNLTEKMIQFMEKRQAKGLVIACNTITASNALKRIKTDIPFIIQIIEPTVKYAVEESLSDNFVILATDVTLKSNLYQNLLKSYDTTARISTHSLPLLVKLAEANNFKPLEAEKLIERLSKEFKKNSTVILGCTHYPFFASIFRRYLDPSIKLIDSSIPIINELRTKLSTLNLFGDRKTKNEYYCSGDKVLLEKLIKDYLMI